MFFVFPFLLLSICVSRTNNFVLNKSNLGEGTNVKQDGKNLIFQDVRNDSSAFPTRKSVFHVIENLTKTLSSNRKLKQFNKKLTNEVPIKRHIQENDEEDTSSIFKNSKSSIATSSPESKRKWPVVEFLSQSDDFKENSQYLDEFEKKEFPFLHDIEKESKISELTPKFVHSYLDLHKNHSKDKPVGLRSLPEQKFSGISCEDGDSCVCRLPSKTGKTSPTYSTVNKCTRTTIVYSLVNFYKPYEIVNIPTGTPKPSTTPPTTRRSSFKDIPMGFPMGIPMGVPLGVPMGIPAGYPAVYPPGFPAAIPDQVSYAPGSPLYYQPNNYKEVSKHKKPCKTHSNDYLYYDDDDDEPENIYVNNEDSIEKQRKHEKKHKGIIIDVEYDVDESRGHKPHENFKCRHKEDLASDILNDLRKSYSDTVIKNCYCCSATSCGIKFRILFLLLILITFC